MFEHLLPIGSIVLLRNAVKKLMIMGYMPYNKEAPETKFDYAGVLYPEGFLGMQGIFLFNHEDIDDVIFRGYQNPEHDRFMQFAEESLSSSASQNEPSGGENE